MKYTYTAVFAEKGVMIPLKRHDFDEGDLRYIKDEIKKAERK